MASSFLQVLGVLLSVSYAATTSAQTKPPPQPLELSVEIINQSACKLNSDSVALELGLRLTYTNVGTRTLLLYKGHDLFYQTRIRNDPTDGKKPYEVMTVNSRYFDEEYEAINERLPGPVFATIHPGGVYRAETAVGIAVVTENSDRGNFAIRGGGHTLQLIVSTWYKSRKLGEELRTKWQPKGLLWIDPLRSAPVHFFAEGSGSVAPCK